MSQETQTITVGVFTATFKKEDGSIRTIKFSASSEKVLSAVQTEATIRVKDLEKDAFRSVPFRRLIGRVLQVGTTTFQVPVEA
tara:strand:+ start:2382 stop:2630 length:249 start_codon:yes stop_codon:yes gene_type:complete